MGLLPSDILIEDDNWQSVEPPVHGHIPRDYEREPYGSLPFAAAFPTELEIPESEWSARIKDLTDRKALISDLWRTMGLVAFHQGSTSMCWMFAVASCLQTVRAQNNQPFVKLSPASAAAPCMNFRDNGGWSSNGVAWVSRNGMSTVDLWGSQTANSSRLWTAEVKADAATRKITEWWDVRPRNFKQQMSLALLCIPAAVGYNRMGHAICQLDPVEIERGAYGLRAVDNYGNNHDGRGMYVMRQSLATADDIIAPRAATSSSK